MDPIIILYIYIKHFYLQTQLQMQMHTKKIFPLIFMLMK